MITDETESHIHYAEAPTKVELLSVEEHVVDIERQAKVSYEAGREFGFSQGVTLGVIGTLIFILCMYLVYS